MTTGPAALPRELHVLVPFWGMAGGVIKILDYAHHASTAGVDVHLWAPALPAPDAAVRSLPVFDVLDGANNVTIFRIDDLSLDDTTHPWVLFTEPAHHALIEHATRSSLGHQLIHLIQGTRHANPSWNGGLHYRLLHRPMSRITVTEQVAESIRPHVNMRFAHHVILEGHDMAYFREGAPDRMPHGRPLRVLYTNWKSRYHAADIFLCTPGPEEGFYLPGLEAMAAGCVVVSSFVGGNEAYMVEGVNCIRVPHDDADAHAAALLELANDRSRHRSLIAAGMETVANHTLERERDEFIDLLCSLAQSSQHAEVT